ncbi:hypothetical protein MASR2M70_01100 [Bacillota bacterium]
MITVKYRGNLPSYTQKDREEIQASCILDVLGFIKNAYGPEAYKEAKRMLITVNNESILLHKGFKTSLKGGDVVSFFPISGGG